MASKTPSPRTAVQAAGRNPGRPREFDTEAALGTALEYFWRKGSRATTRELETVLGMSQSSIYNAFGSKQKLLDAALDRYEERVDQALLPALRASADGLDGITAFFDALRDWVTSDGHRGCMLINLMAEGGGETQSLVARFRRYLEKLRNALRDALARSSACAESSATRQEDRAELLVGMVLGLSTAARGGASAVELNRLVESVRRQIRRWGPSAPA